MENLASFNYECSICKETTTLKANITSQKELESYKEALSLHIDPKPSESLCFLCPNCLRRLMCQKMNN